MRISVRPTVCGAFVTIYNLWLYPVCSYTVALSPVIITSLAVLHTEKLVFQCAKLGIGPAGLGRQGYMNLALLCGDFRTIIFFLLSVSVP